MMGGVDRIEIEQWCVARIAEMLGSRPADIDPAARFTRLGLDSATMINLIVAAEEWLGIEIDPEAVYEHRSVTGLSAYLAGLAGGPPNDPPSEPTGPIDHVEG